MPLIAAFIEALVSAAENSGTVDPEMVNYARAVGKTRQTKLTNRSIAYVLLNGMEDLMSSGNMT